MPVVGAIFGGLDFSNYFIVLASPPAGYTGPMTYEALTKAGVPLFAYGNFITVVDQLHHPRVHHLPDGEADQPAEARGAAAAPPAPARGSAAAARDSRFAEALTVHARRGKPAAAPDSFSESFP